MFIPLPQRVTREGGLTALPARAAFGRLAQWIGALPVPLATAT